VNSVSSQIFQPKDFGGTPAALSGSFALGNKQKIREADASRMYISMMHSVFPAQRMICR